METKPIKIFYGIVLPIVVVILLLGVASFNTRRRIEPETFDFLQRFLLTLWYIGIFNGLSRISSASYYPNRKWTKSDVGQTEKAILIGFIILFSIIFALITLWPIHKFFSINLYLGYVIAFINGVIVFVPLITHYWVIKL